MSLNACKDTDSKKNSKRKKEYETSSPDDLKESSSSSSTFELISEWKGSQKKKKNFTFSCVVCVQQFHKTGLLNKHRIKEHLEDGIYKCLKCDEVFQTKDQVKDHQKGHSGKPYFCCDACGKDYYHDDEYLEHRITHLTTTFECDVCENMKQEPQYQNKYCLKRHMGIHANTRRFICMCGQRFLKQHQYQNHQRMCTKCGICGKMFFNQDSLRTHKGLAHGVEDSSRKHAEQRKDNYFYCNFCGKNFQEVGALEFHVHAAHLTQDVKAYQKAKKSEERAKRRQKEASQKLIIIKSEEESDEDEGENEIVPLQKLSDIKDEQENENEIEPPQNIIKIEDESEKDISKNEIEPPQKLRKI